MEKIDKTIDWSRVESILVKHYTGDISSEGTDADPPFLFFKRILLQRLFRIDSDPKIKK